jgi:DnaJ-class molecular chaperone
MTELFIKLEKTNGNLYGILEIKKDSHKAEVKQAYKRLARIYHPDKQKNLDESDKSTR